MKKHFVTSWRLWVSWAALLTLVIAIPVKADITDLFGDLEVTKAVDKLTAVAGETVTFTIPMKNNPAAITATNVKVIVLHVNGKGNSFTSYGSQFIHSF